MSNFDKADDEATTFSFASPRHTQLQPGEVHFDLHGNAIYEWKDPRLQQDDQRAEKLRSRALAYEGLALVDNEPAANVPVIKNDKGLSTVLSGDHTFAEAILRHGPNLWVLPSGPVPSNPAELLASQAMKNLLENLGTTFRHVIIDSPPVLAVTDATILSSLTDGVLLVAASGSTPRAGLVRARRILANAGARVLGVTMNKLNPHGQSYKNYGYSYSSDK